MTTLLALVPVLAVVLLFAFFKIDDNRKKVQERKELKLETDPIFCVNCKYFSYDSFANGIFSKCLKFPMDGVQLRDATINHLVTGIKKEIVPEFHYCSVARKDYCGMCKAKARFFEKKED